MSVIIIEWTDKVQSRSSRLRKISFVVLILAACATGQSAKCQMPASAGPTQATQVDIGGTSNPEEQVDIDYHETNLMPMPPAAPIAISSVRKIDGGAVFTMRPGAMQVLFCNDSIVHVLYCSRP